MSLPPGFDPAYYLMVHGEVAEAGMDPAEHLLRFGVHEGRTGVPPGRLHPLEQEMHDRFDFMAKAFTALAVNGIDGAYAEFGVAHGKTMWAAWRASRAVGLQAELWAFDSFAGLPEADNEIDAGHPSWLPGRYAVDEARFRANLGAMGVPEADVVTVPGFFADSLRAERRASLPGAVAFAYVDCDMYQSTVDVLDYLQDVLVPGAVVAFDDYYCWSSTSRSGEALALEELLARRTDLRLDRYLPFGWHGQSFYVTR